VNDTLNAEDLETLRQIAIQEARPGEGNIHLGFSDQMVGRGYAVEDGKGEYRLTEAGRLALRQNR